MQGSFLCSVFVVSRDVIFLSCLPILETYFYESSISFELSSEL